MVCGLMRHAAWAWSTPWTMPGMMPCATSRKATRATRWVALAVCFWHNVLLVVCYLQKGHKGGYLPVG
eukprot:1094889-Pelagomonas_calceolata.AAC.3